MDKLNEIKKKIEEMQTKSLVASDMKEFIKLVVLVVTKHKEELSNLSQKNIKIIEDSIAYIESINEKAINSHDTKTNVMVGQIDAKIAILKGLIAKVKTIKPIDGVDGKDGLNGTDGKDGKDGSPDTRLEIVEKINKGEKKDLKIEHKQIEGFDKIEKGILDRAISILDQRTKFLINKGVKHDGTLSGDGSDANPLTVIGGGGGGGGTWGSITGTLSNQTDLQNALDAKQNSITGLDTQVLFFDGANNPAGNAGLTFNKTTGDLTLSANADIIFDASNYISSDSSGFLFRSQNVQVFKASEVDSMYIDDGRVTVGGVSIGDDIFSVYGQSTSRAGIYLDEGSLLSSPKDNTIENNGTHLYYTQGGVRYQLDQQGGGVSFGTDNQVPFMNAAGTDFEYSSNFTHNGSGNLTLGLGISGTAGGGNLAFIAGTGSASGDGGAITVQGGAGGATSGAGGDLTLNGGPTTTNGSGGSVNINGGGNLISGTPGNINIIGGDGGITDQNGGNVNAWGGIGNGTGVRGDVTFRSRSTASLSAIFDTSLISATDKVYFFPDQSGTFALLSDLTAPAWNDITSPTGDQALTFQAGESSTWTNQNTTEDLFTVNTSTLTTGSLFSLNSTSTALASGNNLMELVMSGANGSSSITATPLRISVTNTGTTSTNTALNLTASGASNNYAAFINSGQLIVATGSASLPSIGTNGATSTGIEFLGSSNGMSMNIAGARRHAFNLNEYLGDSNRYIGWNSTVNGPYGGGSVVGIGYEDTSTIKVFQGAAGSGYRDIKARSFVAETSAVPDANDGATLGTTALQWSDLFLAEGGVINWDNGDATLTQAGDVLTLAGADLKVTSPGNVSTSVLTTDATQTLTNKAITKRVVTTTDDATAVIDVAVTDVYQLSAIANNTTFSFTGSPTDGQTFFIRYKDAGVSKTLTWTGIVAIGVTLPSATTVGKWGYVGIQYNSAASAYHAVSATTEI